MGRGRGGGGSPGCPAGRFPGRGDHSGRPEGLSACCRLRRGLRRRDRLRAWPRPHTMAISINPVLPVLSAQEAGSVAPELVLQPGSVVNAQVLKVLSDALVRIAIASLSIDVATEI